MKEIIVPDASVILKWLLPTPHEKNQEDALRLLEQAIQGMVVLKVPTLWIYEVGNTLSREYPKRTKELLDILTDFQLIEISWNKQWLHKCLYLIEHYKVAFYDAAYHSLALTENGTLITADVRYFKQAHVAGSIESLDSWD